MVLTVILVVPAVAITSHLYNPKLPDGREFSEAAWYSVAIVKLSQQTLSDFDAFLSFVSSASNPAQILHRVIPILACIKGPQTALKVLVAYIAADVSNLALKWPLQGDRPFWMDESVRQFGGNTCEVGFGMPSGHVQVTVAAYAVVAEVFQSKVANTLVILAVLLTALSRVHMGAHTPLQVTCGCIAGLATALAVRTSDRALTLWGSHRMSNSARLTYGGAAIVALVGFIWMENSFLVSQDIDIYASISKAMHACRGGLHGVVSSARGIARDVGALLGGVVGVCCRYVGISVAVGERVSWLDLLFSVVAAEVGLVISGGVEGALLFVLKASSEKALAPDMPGGGTWLGVVSADEGAATVAIFGKYCVILTLGMGVAPLLRDTLFGVKGGGEVKVKGGGDQVALSALANRS